MPDCPTPSSRGTRPSERPSTATRAGSLLVQGEPWWCDPSFPNASCQYSVSVVRVCRALRILSPAFNRLPNFTGRSMVFGNYSQNFMDRTIERVVDLLLPSHNRIYNMTVDEARQRVLSGKPEAVRDIDGSFALLAREGKTIRMARSLDRPMRYFLAKRHEGPALIVADRIDTIYNQLKAEALDSQFHPSYTRMVPAHYVTEIQLVGCPDPDPTYRRYFTPQRNALPADLDEIGRRYIGALADEIAKWLKEISPSHSPHPNPLPGGEGTAAGSLALPDGLPTDSAPGYSKNRRTFLPLLGLRTQSRRKTKTFRAGV